MLLNLLKRHFQAFKTHTEAHALQARHFGASPQLNIAFPKPTANCGLASRLIFFDFCLKTEARWMGFDKQIRL